MTRLTSGRAAYVEQWDELRVWCGRLSDDEWPVPSVLGDWRVADLVAHIVLVADSVIAAAGEPTSVKPLTLSDYVAGYAAVAAGIDARTRDSASGGKHAVMVDLERVGEVAKQALSSSVLDNDPVVNARRGPIRWSDFVATRCIELAVHSDDLVRSLPDRSGPALQPACLKVATRALMQVLAKRAPGRSVEVRVPPVAAVQCVAGPRHTRGTPASVVELDEVSFLRLASGRLDWPSATDEGLIKASGQRTDLSAWFPLLS